MAVDLRAFEWANSLKPCLICSTPTSTPTGSCGELCSACWKLKSEQREQSMKARRDTDLREQQMRLDFERDQWMTKVEEKLMLTLVCSQCTITNSWSMAKHIGGFRCNCGNWINEPPLADEAKYNRIFAVMKYQSQKQVEEKSPGSKHIYHQ